MPRREPKSEYRSDPAGLRATANELACAAAAVETRRDAPARMDTMAVGEAITQLGLTVTPNELASEVVALRNQRDALENQTRLQRTNWRNRLFILALVFSIGLNLKLLLSNPESAVSAPVAELVEQSGRFNATAGGEGLVRFPQPYRAVPNLELLLSPIFNKTIVTETMSWGFRWKNSGPDNLFNNSGTPWKAKGVR